MALKRLKVKLAPPVVKAGDIPVIIIEGDLISQYNKASEDKKAAEYLMNDLKPEIKDLGLPVILQRSIDDPANPTKTVKIQDEDGAVLQFQFTSTYSAIADVDLDAAEEIFEDAGIDINEYVQETVSATFDSKVFLDAEGTFQQKVYDEFRKALEAVAKRLNVACPLNTQKVVTPKEKFHVERFRVFPDVDLQLELVDVVKNTTRIVPVTVNKVKAS